MKAKRIGATNEACGVKVWRNPRELNLLDTHVSYQAVNEALYPRLKTRGLLSEPHQEKSA
ncbi:hypothetical protein DF053_30455 [Burkholderia cepacia]|nr:hypothetical protein DF053_30455 [Burkholderia cepacia]